jgi:hypothetical protein
MVRGPHVCVCVILSLAQEIAESTQCCTCLHGRICISPSIFLARFPDISNIHQITNNDMGWVCMQSDEVNPKAFPLAGADLSVTILELVQQVCYAHACIERMLGCTPSHLIFFSSAMSTCHHEFIALACCRMHTCVLLSPCTPQAAVSCMGAVCSSSH